MTAKVKAIIAAFEDESVGARVADHDWSELSADLSNCGCAIIKGLLSREECQQMASLYLQEEHFRSHIRMAQHGFGKGEYRYFKHPLPDLLGKLRTAFLVWPPSPTTGTSEWASINATQHNTASS